jgi:hypothetical protein
VETKEIFILTLGIGMGVLMFIVLPIIIAVFIYKDAQKRPGLGSPISFAMIALFTPLYLGIVYYLYQLDEYQTKLYDENKD